MITKTTKIVVLALAGLAILSIILLAMSNNLAKGQSSASPPVFIPTTTLKVGTGAGNYTTASTTLTPVDSTNQCLGPVVIPVGSKLLVTATGVATTATAAVSMSLALTDNAACSTANAGVLQSATFTPSGIAVPLPYALTWVITGDGNSHNVALQFLTSAAADVATISNSPATLAPTMVFQLVKSN